MKDLSRQAQVYILGSIFIALLLALWQLSQFQSDGLTLLFLTCIAASFLQGLAVFGTTARSTYSLSWIIYSFVFILLGSPSALFVIYFAHLVEWLLARKRLNWYIQFFNMSTFTIAVTIAGLVLSLGKAKWAANSLGSFFTVLTALVLFTASNHFLVGLVLKLARGQSLAQSGVFGRLTLLLDYTLLCLGFAATIIWSISPIGIILVAFITYMLYEAMKIPALERQSETDPKTELYNARYFAEALEDALIHAKRFNRPLSIIMADLDFLRNINNTYGHLAGDVVLQGIARILQETTRDYDIVSRFGGEEFSVLLPETGTEEASIVAERMRQKIEAAEFVISTRDKPIRATMSFGISSRWDNEQTTENLIHNADLALYQAKENGRNRTYIFNHQLNIGVAVSKDTGKMVKVAIENEGGASKKYNSNGQQPNTASSKEAAQKSKIGQQEEFVTLEVGDSPPILGFPKWVTNAFIIFLSLLTTFLTLNLSNNDFQTIDWSGLVIFAATVLIIEALSIEIYVRDTSVSTSAALLVAGVLLFGPVGAILFGTIIAAVAYGKQRSQINRLLFNVNNHILGGLFIVALLSWYPKPIEEWTLWTLVIIGAGSALIIYLSTTSLLAVVICLNSKHNFRAIWDERFRWLAPYYIALGALAATIVFSYNIADYLGLLLIIVPLLLLRYGQKQYVDQTETLVQQLRVSNSELIQKADEITLLNEDLLLTLARSLDLRDPYVMEHSKHVSRYAVCVAEEMRLHPERIEIIRKAGLLHDIGKLGIPEEILFKPGRLSAAEFEIVKDHVTIGAELIRGCHSLAPLAPYVLHHHEWYDGSGYPHGLTGNDIPMEARILSLADAIEAMASDRPYKKAMPPHEILKEVKRWEGVQFDPAVVNAFTRVINRQGENVIINSARNVESRLMSDAKTYPQHY